MCLNSTPVLTAVFLMIFVVGCSGPDEKTPWNPNGNDTSADGDTDTGADTDSDSSTGSSSVSDCGSSAGDGTTLQRVTQFDIPSYRTGVPSVFTDVFVSTEPRLYLVSDEQQCDIAMQNNQPVFTGSGSFCALTPGYVLRGWTKQGGEDHIVDAESMSVVSGNGTNTYSLPSHISEPSGLASDGTRFWISDSVSSRLGVIDPQGPKFSSVESSCQTTKSISFDGEHFWILDGPSLVEINLDGQVCRRFRVTQNLSGLSVQVSKGVAWGVDESTATLYKFDIPSF